jgi:hypothetical protein
MSDEVISIEEVIAYSLDTFPGLIIWFFRACANRRATFRTWQFFEGLYSLLTTACHIRYSPIGAAS